MSLESMSAANQDNKPQQLTLSQAPVIHEKHHDEVAANEFQRDLIDTIAQIGERNKLNPGMNLVSAERNAELLAEQAIRGVISNDHEAQQQAVSILQANPELDNLLMTKDADGKRVGLKYDQALLNEVIRETDKTRQEFLQPTLPIRNRPSANGTLLALKAGSERVAKTRAQDIEDLAISILTEPPKAPADPAEVQEYMARYGVSRDVAVGNLQVIRDSEVSTEQLKREHEFAQQRAQAVQAKQKQAALEEESRINAQKEIEAKNERIAQYRLGEAMKRIPSEMAADITDIRNAITQKLRPGFDPISNESDAHAAAQLEQFSTGNEAKDKFIRGYVDRAIKAVRDLEPQPEVEAKQTTTEDVIHDAIDSLEEAGVTLNSKQALLLAAILQGTKSDTDLLDQLNLSQDQAERVKGIVANHSERLKRVETSTTNETTSKAKTEEVKQIEEKDPLTTKISGIVTKYNLKPESAQDLIDQLTDPNKRNTISQEQIERLQRRAFGGKKAANSNPGGYLEFKRDLNNLLNERDLEAVQAEIERLGPIGEDLAGFAAKYGIDISNPYARRTLEELVDPSLEISEWEYKLIFASDFPNYLELKTELDQIKQARAGEPLKAPGEEPSKGAEKAKVEDLKEIDGRRFKALNIDITDATTAQVAAVERLMNKDYSDLAQFGELIRTAYGRELTTEERADVPRRVEAFQRLSALSDDESKMVQRHLQNLAGNSNVDLYKLAVLTVKENLTDKDVVSLIPEGTEYDEVDIQALKANIGELRAQIQDDLAKMRKPREEARSSDTVDAEKARSEKEAAQFEADFQRAREALKLDGILDPEKLTQKQKQAAVNLAQVGAANDFSIYGPQANILLGSEATDEQRAKLRDAAKENQGKLEVLADHVALIVKAFKVDPKQIEALAFKTDVTLEDLKALAPEGETFDFDTLDNLNLLVREMRDAVNPKQAQPKATAAASRPEPASNPAGTPAAAAGTSSPAGASTAAERTGGTPPPATERAGAAADNAPDVEVEKRTPLTPEQNDIVDTRIIANYANKHGVVLNAAGFKEMIERDQLSVAQLDAYISSLRFADKGVQTMIRRDIIKARDQFGKEGLTYMAPVGGEYYLITPKSGTENSDDKFRNDETVQQRLAQFNRPGQEAPDLLNRLLFGPEKDQTKEAEAFLIEMAKKVGLRIETKKGSGVLDRTKTKALEALLRVRVTKSNEPLDEVRLVNNEAPIAQRETLSTALDKRSEDDKFYALVGLAKSLGIDIESETEVDAADPAKMAALEKVLRTRTNDIRDIDAELTLLLGPQTEAAGSTLARKQDLYSRISKANRFINPPKINDLIQEKTSVSAQTEATGQINPNAPLPGDTSVVTPLPVEPGIGEKVKNLGRKAVNKFKSAYATVTNFQKPDISVRRTASKVLGIFSGLNWEDVGRQAASSQGMMFPFAPGGLRFNDGYSNNERRSDDEPPRPAAPSRPTPPTPPAPSTGGAAVAPSTSSEGARAEDTLRGMMGLTGSAPAVPAAPAQVEAEATGAVNADLEWLRKVENGLRVAYESAEDKSKAHSTKGAAKAEFKRLTGQDWTPEFDINRHRTGQSSQEASNQLDDELPDWLDMSNGETSGDRQSTSADTNEGALLRERLLEQLQRNEAVDNRIAAAAANSQLDATGNGAQTRDGANWDDMEELVGDQAASKQPKKKVTLGQEDGFQKEAVGNPEDLSKLEAYAATPRVQRKIEEALEEASTLFTQYYRLSFTEAQKEEFRKLTDPRHLSNVTPDQRLDFAKRVLGNEAQDENRVNEIARYIEAYARKHYADNLGTEVVRLKIESQINDPVFDKLHNQIVGLKRYLARDIDPRNLSIDLILGAIRDSSDNKVITPISERERKEIKAKIVEYMSENRQRRNGQLDIIGQKLAFGTNGTSPDTGRLDLRDLDAIGSLEDESITEKTLEEFENALQNSDTQAIQNFKLNNIGLVSQRVELLDRYLNARVFSTAEEIKPYPGGYAQAQADFELLTGKPWDYLFSTPVFIATLKAEKIKADLKKKQDSEIKADETEKKQEIESDIEELENKLISTYRLNINDQQKIQLSALLDPRNMVKNDDDKIHASVVALGVADQVTISNIVFSIKAQRTLLYTKHIGQKALDALLPKQIEKEFSEVPQEGREALKQLLDPRLPVNPTIYSNIGYAVNDLKIFKLTEDQRNNLRQRIIEYRARNTDRLEGRFEPVGQSEDPSKPAIRSKAEASKLESSINIQQYVREWEEASIRELVKANPEPLQDYLREINETLRISESGDSAITISNKIIEQLKADFKKVTGRDWVLGDEALTVIENLGKSEAIGSPEIVEIRGVGGASIASIEHPETNEDKIFHNGKNVILVADGIGGHKDGDLASRVVREAAKRHIKNISPNTEIKIVYKQLDLFFERVHTSLNELPVEPGQKAPSSTVALAIVLETPEGRKAIVASSGDSRVYGVDKNTGKIVAITKDDNIFKLLLQGNKISAESFNAIEEALGNANSSVDVIEAVKTLSNEERAYMARFFNSEQVRNIASQDPVLSKTGPASDTDLDNFSTYIFSLRNIITKDASNKPKYEEVLLDQYSGLFAITDGPTDNLTLNELQTLIDDGFKEGLDWTAISEKITQRAIERSKDTSHPRHKPDDCSMVGMNLVGFEADAKALLERTIDLDVKEKERLNHISELFIEEARAHTAFLFDTNNLWQQVDYGPHQRIKTDFAFRGYLMVEPEDMADALKVLREIALERANQGKSTAFKWLKQKKLDTLMTLEEIINSDKPTDIGQYHGLKAQDPRIVLYSMDENEIKDILTSLARDPRWINFEQNRRNRYGGDVKNAPRRPGTSSIKLGKGKTRQEFKTLNFIKPDENGIGGYSEDRASDLNWRDKNEGTNTVQV